MQRRVLGLIILVLAFITGLAAQSLWDSRAYIIDRSTEFVENWQD